MNSTIKSLWIGPKLSTIEKLSMASFLANGHDYHLYVYQDVANVPDGVILKDANSILHESEIFYYGDRAGPGKGSVAGFSNWFRYQLLMKEGGWWADTDVVCLKHFNFQEPYCFGFEHKNSIATGVIKVPKACKLIQHLNRLGENPHTPLPSDNFKVRLKKNIKSGIARIKQERGNFGWADSGPIGMTALVKHYGLGRYAKPPHFFYPVEWENWKDIYFGNIYSDVHNCFHGSYSIHLWNEMLRREKIDKNATFRSDSLIEKLKREYLNT